MLRSELVQQDRYQVSHGELTDESAWAPMRGGTENPSVSGGVGRLGRERAQDGTGAAWFLGCQKVKEYEHGETRSWETKLSQLDFITF